jgi:hypothetical protein
MTSLVDRYVLTTLRRVPEDQRTDIDQELRASIADAVDARVEAGEERDTAVEQTLLELGDPDKLADQYAGRPRYLIGPELYGPWLRLMKAVYSTVLPIIVAVLAILGAIGRAGIGELIGDAIGTLITVGAHMAFWVTLVFVIAERTGTGKDDLRLGAWHPDKLPHYEDGRSRQGQLVVDLSWIALLVALLILQQFTFTETPVLNPGNWTFWFPYLIAILVVEGVYSIWTRRAAVRTHAMTAANAALALLSGGPIIWLLAEDRFLNPALLTSGETRHWVSGILIAVTAVITLWDVADQFLRTHRSRRDAVTA